MAEQQETYAIEVPAALGQVVAANAEFEVLLCVKPQCRKAVSPGGAVEHLRKIYREKPKVRKQVQEFVVGIP
jgi:hypothetical protein